jgi:hypothetical protein
MSPGPTTRPFTRGESDSIVTTWPFEVTTDHTLRAIDRDVKKSESVVPFQWSFRQWAGQNPEIKRILAGEKEAPQGQ